MTAPSPPEEAHAWRIDAIGELLANRVRGKKLGELGKFPSL